MENKVPEINRVALKKLGEEDYNKFILTERAFNQKFWIDKMLRALKSKGSGTDRILRLGVVLDEMDEQTKDYFKRIGK